MKDYIQLYQYVYHLLNRSWHRRTKKEPAKFYNLKRPRKTKKIVNKCVRTKLPDPEVKNGEIIVSLEF